MVVEETVNIVHLITSPWTPSSATCLSTPWGFLPTGLCCWRNPGNGFEIPLECFLVSASLQSIMKYLRENKCWSTFIFFFLNYFDAQLNCNCQLAQWLLGHLLLPNIKVISEKTKKHNALNFHNKLPVVCCKRIAASDRFLKAAEKRWRRRLARMRTAHTPIQLCCRCASTTQSCGCSPRESLMRSPEPLVLAAGRPLGWAESQAMAPPPPATRITLAQFSR